MRIRARERAMGLSVSVGTAAGLRVARGKAVAVIEIDHAEGQGGEIAAAHVGADVAQMLIAFLGDVSLRVGHPVLRVVLAPEEKEVFGAAPEAKAVGGDGPDLGGEAEGII